MTELLKGRPVAEAIDGYNRTRCESLREEGIIPALAVFRIGEKDADLSYERGIAKKCEAAGIELKVFPFKEDVAAEEFYDELDKANADPAIHGILVFRPLPKRFDDDELRNRIIPHKDIDGCSDLSLAGVFVKKDLGFIPCTAQAALEILDHYGVDVSGKNVVVLGRSLVIGKPVSLLLVNRNATVTICHTGTQNIAQIASKADILICATGQMESVTREYVNEKQIIIDVGIGWNEEKQKLCGDVDFEDVKDCVKAITPVPGGVGSVTTSVLLKHVLEAAERSKYQQA